MEPYAHLNARAGRGYSSPVYLEPPEYYSRRHDHPSYPPRHPHPHPHPFFEPPLRRPMPHHQEQLIRVYDGPIQPNFDRDPRRAVDVPTGRKRPPWDQDRRALDPHDFPPRPHRRLMPPDDVLCEYDFEGPGRGEEVLSGVSPDRFVLRRGEQGLRNGYLPHQGERPSKIAYVSDRPEEPSCSSRIGFASPPLPPLNRSGEPFYGFDRRPPPAPLRPYANTRSGMEEFFDGNMASLSEALGLNENHGFCQENRSVGIKGKRRIPTSGSSQSPVGTPSKRNFRKGSALSRIQSTVSVWERIEEKPAAVPTPPPRSVPPGFSDGTIPEVDALDLSCKSNIRVAKVLAPPCSTTVSNEEKDGQVGKSLKKKAVKKKVAKDETLKKSLAAGSSKTLEATEKNLGSSSKVVTNSKSQLCVKKVSATPSVGKSVVKKSANIINTTKKTPLVKGAKKETRERPNLVIAELGTSDASGSQFCQLEPTAVTLAPPEKNAAEKSAGSVNRIEMGYVESISVEGNEMPCNENSQPCADTLTSNSGSLNEQFSHIQGPTIILSSSENSSPEEPANAIGFNENGIDESPSQVERYLTHQTWDGAQIASPFLLEGGLQSYMVDVSVTPSIGSEPLEGDNLETKSDRECLEQKSEVIELQKQLDLFSGYEKKNCDVFMNPHEEDSLTRLCPLGNDINVEQSLLDGAADDGVTLQTRTEPAESDCLRVGEGGVVLVSDSLDKRMGDDPHFRLAETDSPLIISDAQDIMHNLDAEQHHFGDGKNIENHGDNTSSKDERLETEDDAKWDKLMQLDCHNAQKTQLLRSNDLMRPGAADPESAVGEKTLHIKSFPGPQFQGLLPDRRSLAGFFKEKARSKRNVRSKTWHRSNNADPASLVHENLPSSGVNILHKPSPKKLGKLHTSYVRKGNCLIRKSAGESSVQRPSYDLVSTGRVSKRVMNNKVGTDSKVDTISKVAYSNPSSERPKSPPLPLSNKSPDLDANLPTNGPHPISGNLISESGVQAQSRPHEPLDSKRMIYRKPNSYQLVATSGPECCDSSLYSMKKARNLLSSAPTDLYHRKKKNQLIRNASTGVQLEQDVVISVDIPNSDDQRASNFSSLKSSKSGLDKKEIRSAQQTTYKQSKFSLVWTLSGEQSDRKGALLNQWKYLPYLFPWKRTAYWKSSRSGTASMVNRRSFSLIGKLQLARKRNTIYTVSNHGYSLRKAGVLSVGGSSLKWSKSIESRSKKASEEATLAVAEAERKKRERKRRTSFGRREKNGERIFRIGSARYKMDSTRRTLIRIPDDQVPCNNGQQPGNSSRISVVPKRLLIGNDEYIRIGNGNQLIRDPKKLVRILANEKVRWSVHTARLRVARKQQYCQFFTRFGKCNKNGGRCPYIHDSEKVAICTKFLKGLCSNNNCKLTHKVLPERMPDCSYFLRGICTNINCPYRHVNVNPNASVCEGFLRGYCADGDECCKKHSYVCPLYEATGKCPQGSTCKLQHPKSRNKSKKRKRTAIPSNSKRRYFCSSIIEVGEPVIVASDDIVLQKGGDLFYSDGQFTDYVSLDASSDSVTDTNLQMDFHPALSDSCQSDMQLDELDALIKPIRIMNKANLMQSSAVS